MIGLQGGPERPVGSHLARGDAAEHVRVAELNGGGRVRWTAGNLVRLAAVVSVVGAIVIGLAYGGWSLGRDEAESQAAVREYFDAIASGEIAAESVLTSCDGPVPLQEHTGVAVAAALDAESLAGTELLVSAGQDMDGLREHDFEVRGLVRGRALLERTDADGWRVCGLIGPWLELVSSG